MEVNKLLGIVFFLFLGRLGAQELHSHANAASINNEANSTTGWTGSAIISSDANDAQFGDYSIMAVSTANDGRTLDYNFQAQIGEQYTIRIWARVGTQVSNGVTPAFAVWSGLSGFETTVIEGNNWNEYVFNVTATSNSCMIRIYTSQRSTRFQSGNTIYIDRVTITPNTVQPDDTEPPSAVTTLNTTATTATSTQLNWLASTDNIGVDFYEVYRDNQVIGTTNQLAFTANSLTANTTYAFTILAYDTAGNISLTGNTVNVTTLSNPDTEPPSAVTTLNATATTATSTQLNWLASTDNIGVEFYEIYRDNQVIGTTSQLTFTPNDLTTNTTYAFTILAYDTAGNVSLAGNTVNVTTLSNPDTEPPSAVTTLNATATTATSTQLNWLASTDNIGVDFYEVYRDNQVIGTTNQLTFTANSLTANTTYAFTILAYDSAGNASLEGNSIQVQTLAADPVHYTAENANLSTIDWSARDLIVYQNLAIGTTDTMGYQLAVAGEVIAEGIKVALQGNWPDFVFLKDYPLPSLKEVEKHIKDKGHLIGIPNANDIKLNGINLGEMDALLLKKIEELTLYILLQEKKINKLEKVNYDLKQLTKKVLELENKINEE